MPDAKIIQLMDLNKVLYISQEITPYLAADDLSVFGRDLPQSIQETGVEVRTFMPRYGAINERRNQLHEVIRLSGLNIVINDTDHPLIIKVATLQPSRMQVYFIDNDDYFRRHASELETVSDPGENDERTIFFVRGVLETARKLRWLPSVIHCTGWISALAPLYLKKIYAEDPAFSNARIVFSLYKQDFPEPFTPQFIDKLVEDGISREDLGALGDGPVGMAELCRLAIDHADAVAISSTDVDPELIEYARATGKPLLEYPGDAPYAEAYGEFYRSL